jgi:hypothetical protein
MALIGGVMARCLSTARAARWFWIPVALCAACVIPASVIGMFASFSLATSIALSLFFIALMMTTLAACTPTHHRSFAMGCALVGWVYVLLHLGPVPDLLLGPNLLTTTVLQHLHESLHPEATAAAMPAPGYPVYGSNIAWQVRGSAIYGTPELLPGHALLALLMAVFGGLLAAWLAHPKPEVAPGKQERLTL